MKKLIIAAGLLLALLAGGALLLPRYLDWNALRPQLAAAASQLTGRQVLIEGEISVVLLPKPVLTASRVRVPGEAGAPPPLRLEALQLRLSPAPLLTGNIRLERLVLIGPEIIVVRRADGTYNWSWPEAGAADAASQMTFDEIAIERGTLIYQGNGGRERRLDDLQVAANLASLSGPLSAEGGFVAGGRPFRFLLRLARRGADGSLAVPRMSLILPADGGVIEFRGQLSDDAEQHRLTGALNFRSRDLSATAAALGLAGAWPPLPVTAEARLDARGGEAALNDISLRLAEAQLTGAVHLSFGERVFADAAVTAGRLDLDALLRPLADGSAAAEQRWELPDGWNLPSQLRGNLALSIGGLGWRGEMMRQVEVALAAGEDGLRVDTARALLPGSSQVALSGTFAAAQGAPRFDGRLELKSANLQRLLAWLGHDFDGAAAIRPARFFLATGLSLTPHLLQAQEARIELDGTNATGGLTYRLQGRPSFGLELALDRLDLDDYLRAPGGIAGDPLTLLQRFDSNLKLSAAQLAWGGRTFKGISLDLGLVQGQLTVREARIADLAGGELVLHASAGGFTEKPIYIGDLQLTSGDPAALAAAIGFGLPAAYARLAPLSLEARFEGMGPDLSLQATGRLSDSNFALEGLIADLAGAPQLDLSARLIEAPLGDLAAASGLPLPAAIEATLPVTLAARLSGPLRPLSLALAAEAAGADIEVSGNLNAAEKAVFDLAVTASHDDAAQLLDRLGLDGAAKATSGGLALSARLVGKGHEVRLDDIGLRLGANRLAGAIVLRSDTPRPRIDSRLSLDDLDLAAWLPVLPPGTSALRDAAEPPADVLERYDGRLELDARTLTAGPISLRDVAGVVVLERGIFALERLQGRLFGGAVTMNGQFVPGRPAALELAASLEDADLGQALGALLGDRTPAGRLSLNGAVQSLGSGLPALLANLGGSIEVTVQDGSVAGFDLPALDRTIARGLAPEAAAAAVARAFGSGRTRLLAARGRGRLAAGVLVTDQSQLTLDGGTARLTGELSVETERLALRLELLPDALPQAPPIIVRLQGPAAAPEVTVDAAAFSNYLARRAAETVP